MSKMDELRALREARYAQRAAGETPPAARPTGRRPAERPEVRSPGGDPEGPGAELCGHRAISGRTCTRERGHTAKSHRYS